jgi:hypothetical protein
LQALNGFVSGASPIRGCRHQPHGGTHKGGGLHPPYACYSEQQANNLGMSVLCGQSERATTRFGVRGREQAGIVHEP